MRKLRVPEFDGTFKEHYYNVYYGYIINTARGAGIDVQQSPKDTNVWCGGKNNLFSCEYDHQQVIFDFSNHIKFQGQPDTYNAPYFKFHLVYNYPQHRAHLNVFPMMPQIMFDWKDFVTHRASIKYNAKSNEIVFNQRPRAGALERRTKVIDILIARYGGLVSTEFFRGGQKEWWLKQNNCLVTVAIPGARKDIMDKGFWEVCGLGGCIISPPLNILLPGYRRLEPWFHYIPIEYDFSDLVEKVEWCKQRRKQCVAIGRNAQALFDDICPPHRIWEWVDGCVRTFRANRGEANV